MIFLLILASSLFNSLDPTSLKEHLAFYELYKDTPEGKLALQHAWKLIACDESFKVDFFENAASCLTLLNPKSIALDPKTASSIQGLCSHLANRRLKGYRATSIDEILALPSNEIDLAKALLISQETQDLQTVEASCDLMALAVLAKLEKDANDYDKIQALNQFIFFDMGFRFPPHSAYNGKIDLFTFLPHVLESRRGVCLGVSILYLALAQRIGLELEIVTPPGHIYLRYKDKNIETTCRGVHRPSEDYLNISTKTLQTRTLKEVIGMAHYNQASSFLAQQDFQKARTSYEKAFAFMPDDYTLKILYGCTLLLCDQEKDAFAILQKAKSCPDPYHVSSNPLLDDVLQKRVDKMGLIPYFLYVDHTRESIVRKKNALEIVCKENPQFRAGLFQLATSWLQLERESDAIKVLMQYHEQDPHDITVEFYLAELYYCRFDAPASKKHCAIAEDLATKANHNPKTLQKLKTQLLIRSR